MTGQLAALGSPPTPADYENSQMCASANYNLDLQVMVPEPGTLAFALIGLGAIMIRRKIRK
jgi:hypothetical protein